jgi:DUF4097 and DUF4098 domain-containing protein YvlB
MMKSILPAVLVWVAVVLAAATCGCTDGDSGPEVTAFFDDEYRANEKTVLSVENPGGQVTITRGDVKDVVLHAVKRSRAGEGELEKVEITATRGDFLKIRARWLSALPPRVTVDMAITVPPYVTVDAVTASNGDARITGTRGDIDVTCFKGDVVISDVDGYVTAAVENGNIEVRDTAGIGDLTARNGRIEAEVRDVTGDVTIEAKDGGIALAIDPSLDALLAVTANNGVVSVEGLPLEVTAETLTTVNGVLGTGGPTIAIECTNADVQISAL